MQRLTIINLYVLIFSSLMFLMKDMILLTITRKEITCA